MGVDKDEEEINILFARLGPYLGVHVLCCTCMAWHALTFLAYALHQAIN